MEITLWFFQFSQNYIESKSWLLYRQQHSLPPPLTSNFFFRASYCDSAPNLLWHLFQNIHTNPLTRKCFMHYHRVMTISHIATANPATVPSVVNNIDSEDKEKHGNTYNTYHDPNIKKELQKNRPHYTYSITRQTRRSLSSSNAAIHYFQVT